MSTQLTVAAVQLTSTTDVEANLQRASRLTEAALGAGARLVLLPENFGFLGPEQGKLEHARPLQESYFLAPFRELARQAEAFVVAGGFPEQGPDAQHAYNSSVVIQPDGQLGAVYRKIHLFDVDLADGFSVRESNAVAPGNTTVVTELLGWQVGLSICYDLRFPELYRALEAQGARILTVPAAFTLHIGKDHWDLLLRARAVENQCFLIAAAQFGDHGDNRRSWGKSQIIDPWGTQLAVAPEREGFVLATLNPNDMQRVRTQLPCHAHRRLQ